MRVRNINRLNLWIILIVVACSFIGSYVSAIAMPEDFSRYFAVKQDKRSLFEKALNLVDENIGDVGQSFALVLGVSDYPLLEGEERSLPPAAIDRDKLVYYLREYEKFDEIVVLWNDDMNFHNLTFFMQDYFPRRLKKSPRSRFLLAYSGHGFADGDKSYLVTTSARSLVDKANSINVKSLSVLVDEVVDVAHHVIVLINACYAGDFLQRKAFGKQFKPSLPGAHAITAGGSGELTWHDSRLGKGSIFFEKLFTGLEGRADILPTQKDGTIGDGIVNVSELYAYLQQEVSIFTDEAQNPKYGDLSRHGSKGGFFFLSQQRQIDAGLVAKIDWSKATPMGIQAASSVDRAIRDYQDGNWDGVIKSLIAGARSGRVDAMLLVGIMYIDGNGVTKDKALGTHWLKKAADAGNAYATYQLAKITAEKQEAMELYCEAFGRFETLAKAGDATAMMVVVELMPFLSTPCIEPNAQDSRYWLQRAESIGSKDPMVLLDLAQIYIKGRSKIGISPDATKAKKLLQRSRTLLAENAVRGDRQAMYRLGRTFMVGLDFHVGVDFAQARKWFLKASELGHPTAMYQLAKMYQFSAYGEENLEEAIHWYSSAAEAGHRQSMVTIGYSYAYGVGVTRDLDVAEDWLSRAYRLGSEDAAQKLKEIGRPAQKGIN